MTKPKWTRYAELPRKGWLAMECNVDERHAQDDRRHREAGCGSHGESGGSVWVRNDHAADLGKASWALARIQQLHDELRGPMTANDILLTLAEIHEHQRALVAALELFQAIAYMEEPTTLEELEQFVTELSQWL